MGVMTIAIARMVVVAKKKRKKSGGKKAWCIGIDWFGI